MDKVVLCVNSASSSGLVYSSKSTVFSEPRRPSLPTCPALAVQHNATVFCLARLWSLETLEAPLHFTCHNLYLYLYLSCSWLRVSLQEEQVSVLPGRPSASARPPLRVPRAPVPR